MKFSPAILLPFLMYCSQFAHAEYFAAPYFREAAVNVDGILDEEIYSCLEFISFDSRLTHSGKTDIAIVEGRSEKNTTGAAGMACIWQSFHLLTMPEKSYHPPAKCPMDYLNFSVAMICLKFISTRT